MPSFFSWQVETVLFFLAEKEKNGFKKRFFGCGGNRKKRADRVVRPYKVRRKIGGTGGQGRPPLRVRWKIGGTGGQGRMKPLSAAGIWADRVVRPYGCGGRSEVVPMY